MRYIYPFPNGKFEPLNSIIVKSNDINFHIRFLISVIWMFTNCLSHPFICMGYRLAPWLNNIPIEMINSLDLINSIETQTEKYLCHLIPSYQLNCIWGWYNHRISHFIWHHPLSIFHQCPLVRYATSCEVDYSIRIDEWFYSTY